MKNSMFLVVIFFLSLVGCAGPKLSINHTVTPIREIKSIAIAPNSGELGDAVGFNLFLLGKRVVDKNTTTLIFDEANIFGIDVTSEKGFSLLKKKDIDALLLLTEIMARDGKPDRASAKMFDTQDGNLIVDVTWKNGWGGMRGSMADRTMREDASKAAKDIAHELVMRLVNKKNFIKYRIDRDQYARNSTLKLPLCGAGWKNLNFIQCWEN